MHVFNFQKPTQPLLPRSVLQKCVKDNSQATIWEVFRKRRRPHGLDVDFCPVMRASKKYYNWVNSRWWFQMFFIFIPI